MAEAYEVLMGLKQLKLQTHAFFPYHNDLARLGYILGNKGELKIGVRNLIGLLRQAYQIVRSKRVKDWFYQGTVKLPSGDAQQIFVCQNESGRFHNNVTSRLLAKLYPFFTYKPKEEK